MKKALLVDDEHLILYSISTTLKADGYAVTSVENGTAALKEIAAQDFDVCFLDVNLPDVNGLDIMKVVRQRSPRTGIVIMTAADLSDQQWASIRSNGGHFLPKPFDIEHVRALAAKLSTSPATTEPPDNVVSRFGTLG